MVLGMPASINHIEVSAGSLDPVEAAQIYKEYGCLVVRGLMKPYLEEISRDIQAAAGQSLKLLDRARKVPEGWVTPDGTLFIPAPQGFLRDKQIMVLGVGYHTSGALFRSAFDPNLVEILKNVIGPDIELFLNGQCLYKEPVGGHPKNLHQDSAYFEHRFEGPVAVLSYVVDTDLVNGALHVFPGSHKLGTLKHIDTLSHLGLDPQEWSWENALAVTGQAGDSIFFHYRTIHGSKENHSQGPRPVFIHRYRRPDDYVVVSATTADAREQAEKHADEITKANQQGYMVSGFRRFEA